MRKQTNRCTCASACEPFELNDTYKSIACRNCFEIISYDIIKTQTTKKQNNTIRGTIDDFINVLKKMHPDIC